MIRIDEIKIYDDIKDELVLEKAIRKYKIRQEDILQANIVKKSIDARHKNDVHYSYSVEFKVKDESRYPNLKTVPDYKMEPVIVKRNSRYQPIIVGSGPAGLFCALTLIENGIAPLIIEQGDCVEERMKAVAKYRSNGQLNEKCNVQFGEGGAGTFSDGKLNSGINSAFTREVLNTFHRFGAPKEITYLNKPHIGTDNLVKVVSNIRHYIEAKGGKYYFNTCFQSYEKKEDHLVVNCGEHSFETDCLVLAIGHSARPTFEMLKSSNVEMVRKNFSVGVRIEHPQSMINQSQYGTATKLKLPAAEYKLVYHGTLGRSCYSFCMCPGGEVVASSSDQDGVVTNGMSYFARDGVNANAALLVDVKTTDFDGDDPLAGMYFQRELEKKAFIMAGSNHFAPVQLVGDFEAGRVSEKIGKVVPTYQPGYTFCDLNGILPDYVCTTMKEALPYFERKIHGFNDRDAVLTGVETRTSSPVTILRNDQLQSNVAGIYPCGEGAGYAGGITSAAVDGIKVAIAILTTEKAA